MDIKVPVLPDNLDLSQLEELEDYQSMASLAPKNMIGFTQINSIWLKGPSSAFYPGLDYWFDPELINTTDFNLIRTSETILVAPKNPGLYRFEFSANAWGRKASSLMVSLLRYPGNYQKASLTEDFTDGMSRRIGFSELVRVQQGQAFYIAVRQFDANGDCRLCIGMNTAEEAIIHSNLRVIKVAD